MLKNVLGATCVTVALAAMTIGAISAEMERRCKVHEVSAADCVAMGFAGGRP